MVGRRLGVTTGQGNMRQKLFERSFMIKKLDTTNNVRKVSVENCLK